ncbi:Trm112 family protein [Bartonella sp. CB178]|uniref:Trm112 family protein n=1 Tax=Bartonella sp. CB178 TaxID=3112255 RepID=UPI00300E4A41
MKKIATDPKMLELLVCPVTGSTLSLSRKTQELISPKAKLAYPIRNGIPIMLASEARSLKQNEELPIKK